MRRVRIPIAEVCISLHIISHDFIYRLHIGAIDGQEPQLDPTYGLTIDEIELAQAIDLGRRHLLASYAL